MLSIFEKIKYPADVLDVPQSKTAFPRDPFLNLFQSQLAVIYRCQPSKNYEFKYISENITIHFGYELRELSEDPKFWANHVHPDDLHRVLEERSILYREGQSKHDYRFLHKNGQYRWIHDELKLIRDDDHHPLEIVGSWLDITDRKRVRSEVVNILRFHEENPEPMLRVSRNGLVVYANKASKLFLQELKCGEGQFLPVVWKQTISFVFPYGTRKEVEFQVGNIIYSMLLVPVAGTDYINIYGRDITERKQAEEELRKSKKEYVDLFNKVSDIMFTHSLTGRILMVNEAVKRLLGYDLDEVVGKSLLEITTARYHDQVEKYLQEIKVKGEATGLIGFLGKDRKEYIFEYKNSVINKDGQAIAVRGIARDITERKHAEEAVLAQKVRFQQLFENSPIGIVILDENDRIVQVNKGFEDIFQFSTTEVIGQYLNKLVVPENLKEESARFSALTLAGEAFGRETVRRRKDGSPVNVGVYGVPIKWDQKTVGIFAIYVNQTQQKLAEQNINKLNEDLITANRALTIERDKEKENVAILEKLNQMKNEFVSSVSHELRTPLASIIGFSETILGDPNLPNETQNEFMQIILNEGKRLSNLVNDMLDLARIESGRTNIEKTERDLIPLFHRAISALENQIQMKSHKVIWNFAQEKIIAEFDQDRIFQVILNLISNAIKFTPDHGRIVIQAGVSNSVVEIEVHDNGLGIPSSDLPFLFDKFFRVHRPNVEIRGTGLGLAIVKHLVELHHGTITVESKENQGSTFRIRFPEK